MKVHEISVDTLIAMGKDFERCIGLVRVEGVCASGGRVFEVARNKKNEPSIRFEVFIQECPGDIRGQMKLKKDYEMVLKDNTRVLLYDHYCIIMEGNAAQIVLFPRITTILEEAEKALAGQVKSEKA